ncbi:MAG: hypothetical protein J6K45_06400 [Clostridia bacterium]|nr:hypothetical protein [Clostridia bacterium]
MERLNLDSTLLKPVKEAIEISIDTLMPSVLKDNKEAEISVKINLNHTTQREFDEGKVTKEWLEPEIDFKLTEKLKENKNTRQGLLGREYEVALDGDNKTYVRKVNEQMSLLELEEGQDEQ